MSTDAVIRFLGGAGSVTGSKFLIEVGGARILIDCGLYQGGKELRLRNWAPFPVPPPSLDAIVLTHAHLDHVGYLPLLVREGFRGEVVCTAATRALSRIVLPDSARLQEREADLANARGYSRHHPALPLYTERDAHRAIERLRPVPYDEVREVASGITATMRRAGHILGSATVEVGLPSSTLLFTGDLGRSSHPLLRPPDPPPAADAVIVESTYGDRAHMEGDVLDRLADTIGRTAQRGGTVVIPAFAVDRTEMVLYHLRGLMDAGRIPRLTVFADSPMALAALDVYREALARGDPEIRADLGPDPFSTGDLIEARSVEESKAINDHRGPSIIVSASGMATGGRVLHHLARLLPGGQNTVILPGFQVEGTRGRSLADGAQAVKIHGEYIPVHAEIVYLPGLSAHADGDDMVAWLAQMPAEPATAFVVHGEPSASAAMRDRIATKLGWTAVVPAYREHVRIPARVPGRGTEEVAP